MTCSRCHGEFEELLLVPVPGTTKTRAVCGYCSTRLPMELTCHGCGQGYDELLLVRHPVTGQPTHQCASCLRVGALPDLMHPFPPLVAA